MQLKIGTKMYDRFTKVPIPLTVKFYLFNVTNSDQVLAGFERPKFQEIGPFIYKQWRRRDVVDFEDYNRKIRYKEYKTFYPMFSLDNHISSRHDSEMKTAHNGTGSSNEQVYLNPADFNVTIVNLPLLSILTKLAQLEDGTFKRNLAAKIASRLIADGKDKILITRPANEILFDGYKVDFMESARDLISSTLGFNFESPLPRNRFGFFFMKNGTWTKKENGELTVFTGRNDSMRDFMLVDNWNDLRELKVWPNDTPAGSKCNEIKGTDGSQFHPGVNKNQVLSLFSPMVCRSLFIKYKEDTQTRDIPLLRFTTPAELFAAPRKRPENACFCTISNNHSGGSTTSTATTSVAPGRSSSHNNGQKKSRISDSRCYLDGLMDLSLCQKGAPVAASSPHFYNADPMLAMSAGLKPDKELHETFLDIEPMTGSVFRAASRAQLNAFVEQAALDAVDSSIIGNMTSMIAPLLWLEERGEIDDKSSTEFKSQLLNLVLKAKRTFKYSIIVGVILTIIISAQYWYVTCYTTSSYEAGPTNSKKVTNKRFKGKQMRDNINLANARKSNLAAKLASNIDLSEKLSGAGKVMPAIAIAGVLGAASAGPSGGKSNRRPRRTDIDAGADEHELSKQMLVGHEWEPGQVTTNTESSGRSTSSRAVDDDDDDDDEGEEFDLMRPGTSHSAF